jgi:uncharacterized membrane protein HdeD (DUF308 family)
MAAYPKAQYKSVGARPAVRRGGFAVLGGLLIAVGLFALVFPLVAALSINLVAGLALMAGGLVTLFHAPRLRGWRGVVWQMLLGALYLGAGLIVLANPFAGLFALTVMLGAFFAADGAGRVLLARRIRPQRGWGMFLASGLLSLLLGVLVLLGLPGGWSVAVLGLVIGINMVLIGASFLACAGSDFR